MEVPVDFPARPIRLDMRGAKNALVRNVRIECGYPVAIDHATEVTFKGVLCICQAVGWQKYIQYAEIYGDNSIERWSLAEADSRAKDEVLAALHVAHQARTTGRGLHEYVTSTQERNVLVLGSYDAEGRARLDRIAAILINCGYEPIFISDIPDFEQYDLSQKVVTIAALSRFIVVDDSEASGHLAEVPLCRNNNWVTILLRLADRPASFMTAASSASSRVILERGYAPDTLEPVLTAATQWAEEIRTELGMIYNSEYPWRI